MALRFAPSRFSAETPGLETRLSFLPKEAGIVPCLRHPGVPVPSPGITKARCPGERPKLPKISLWHQSDLHGLPSWDFSPGGERLLFEPVPRRWRPAGDKAGFVWPGRQVPAVAGPWVWGLNPLTAAACRGHLPPLPILTGSNPARRSPHCPTQPQRPRGSWHITGSPGGVCTWQGPRGQLARGWEPAGPVTWPFVSELGEGRSCRSGSSPSHGTTSNGG